ALPRWRSRRAKGCFKLELLLDCVDHRLWRWASPSSVEITYVRNRRDLLAQRGDVHCVSGADELPFWGRRVLPQRGHRTREARKQVQLDLGQDARAHQRVQLILGGFHLG